MEPIIIKKYSNRRLYHTQKKSYITLEELAQFIRNGEDVKVVDNQSGEEITQETLMQIILSGDRPKKIFSVDLLHQMIRFQEEHLQEFLRFYLGSGLQYFDKFKKNMAQQVDIWGQMLGSIMPGFPPAAKKSKNDDLQQIEERMSHYEQKIKDLENKLDQKSSEE